MDIYDLAPQISVLDVEGDGGNPSFRYRFVGTQLVEWRGRLRPADPTGRLLDEIEWPFDPAPLVATCVKTVVTAKPQILMPDKLISRSYRRFRRGLFPLGTAEGQVEQLLMFADPLTGV